MITAHEVHQRFKDLPGSEYIASENAIRGLIRILQRTRPRRILEIGSGIGTLSYTIISTMEALRGRDYRLVMVESNEFCRTRLPVNLRDKFARARLLRHIGDITDREFDLIIVDGADTSDGRYLTLLADRGMVFVEGDRGPQRHIIESSRRSYVRALYRSMQVEHAAGHHLRSPGRAVRWGGGYWVYQFHPTWCERGRYLADHLWHGILVTKRRRIKQLRVSLLDSIRPTRQAKPTSPVRH